MKNDLNDVFVDVAHECYLRVRRLREGSEPAETAEHAITLLLSGDRPEKDKALMVHDLLTNARFSVRRSRARRNAAIESAGHLAARGIASGATRGPVEIDTPEDAVCAKELLGCLHTEACRCGVHGPQILTGLLNGATTREMAEAAGVSPSTVARTVRTLRQAVVASGYCEAA